jgi:putative acetyltransferase
VNLRVEAPGDREAVKEVHLRAFGDHGAVVDALRPSITASVGLSLLAEHNGVVVGHVMFTTCLLDAPPQLVRVQVLSPLAVAPEHQGTGVGSELVRSGLSTMAERGVPIVFLEGDPGYYARFGFIPGAERGFRKPSLRIPYAAFQAVLLAAYEPWMTGTLVYSEPFWQHDAVGLRRPIAPSP